MIDGVTIETSTGLISGGNYNPKTKVIKIDSDKRKDVDSATSTLLYELVRAKHAGDQLDLDAKANKGTLTKNEYSTACERLSYQYMAEHHTIAAKGVTNNQWIASIDKFKGALAGDFSTFDKYLASAKSTGHYHVFENRYDNLRK